MNSAENKQLFFLSGLPRSGSTLLGAILSQNPRVFVTPTSPLVDVLNHMQAAWKNIPSAGAWGDSNIINNVYSAIVQSFHRHIERPVIIDKHRAWPRNIPGLTRILGRPPKIICTVRDVTEILASFVVLVRAARENKRDNFLDRRLRELGLPPTLENECAKHFENMSGPAEALKIGLDSCPECLHLVEYNDLIGRPESVLSEIYRFLEIEGYPHDFQRLANLVHERDDFWGLDGLHAVRPVLRKTSRPAREVLGDSLYARYSGGSLEFWRTV